jgi:hypothetical protein
MCTAMAAGGTIQRLNPDPASVAARSSQEIEDVAME